MPDLLYSDAGLTMTKQFESLVLTAYQDQVGVWTIGYGHTGRSVYGGLTITSDQADHLLASDIAGSTVCVNRAVSVPLTQNQFDALVDFVFNLGGTALLTSTLLRLLNTGNFPAAAAQFPLWDHAKGMVIPGLLRRRQAEALLFQTPCN